MGIIRKTASISTLGLVNFRSKAERIDRLESEREASSLALAKTEKKLTRAQKRADKAELKALHASRRAQRERRRAEGSVDSGIVGAADAVVVAGRRAKRRARQAATQASKAVEQAVE